MRRRKRKKSRFNIDKRKAQSIHAKRRAFQRFGITLNRTGLSEIIDQIHSQRKLIYRESRRVGIYKVKYKDKEMFAVYDRDRKSVSTFLTLKMIEGKFFRRRVVPMIEELRDALADIEAKILSDSFSEKDIEKYDKLKEKMNDLFKVVHGQSEMEFMQSKIDELMNMPGPMDWGATIRDVEKAWQKVKESENVLAQAKDKLQEILNEGSNNDEQNC